MENVFVIIFEKQSEAYEAFDEVKECMDYSEDYTLAHMVLVQKIDGKIIPCDGYDAKCRCPVTSTALGGLIGMVIGALAGPVGVIVGSAAGSYIGGKMVVHDMDKSVASIEQLSKGIQEGEHALIAVVQENNEGGFEKQFESFTTNIHKKDAAQVSVDTEYAMELHKKMDKWDAEHPLDEEVETRRADFRKEFANIRESMKVVHDEMEIRTR